MTKKETLSLLDEINTAYPSFLKGRDPEKLAILWQKAMEYQEAKDAHWALIRYMQEDTRGSAPGPGNLIELIENSIPFMEMPVLAEIGGLD